MPITGRPKVLAIRLTFLWSPLFLHKDQIQILHINTIREISHVVMQPLMKSHLSCSHFFAISLVSLSISEYTILGPCIGILITYTANQHSRVNGNMKAPGRRRKATGAASKAQNSKKQREPWSRISRMPDPSKYSSAEGSNVRKGRMRLGR